MPSEASSEPPRPSAGDLLGSWKEIAAYFGKSVLTVQRWEKDEGLPVHRHGHSRQGTVYAYRSELDSWRAGREKIIAAAEAPSAPAVASPARYRRATIGAAAGLFVLTAFAVLSIRGAREAPAYRPIPLTSEPGLEVEPALSPDGTRVAYAAREEGGSAYHIYVKPVAASGRATLIARHARRPRWSPDGRKLVLLRPHARGVADVIVISNGAGEQRITTIGGEAVGWIGGDVAAIDREGLGEPWAVFSFSGAARRRITTPPWHSRGDVDFAVSPDGQQVAVARYLSGSEGDVYVAPITGGEPKRLTTDRCWLRGLAWAPDNRQVLFSSNRSGPGFSIWRIASSGGAVTRIAGSEGWATFPTAGGSRLVYQLEVRDADIWHASLTMEQAVERRLIASTWSDLAPQFSPDGSKIAFTSNRSGDREIWIAAADGSGATQLTAVRGPWTDSGRWSPDGRRLAFTAHEGGNRDIFLVDLNGAAPRRLTTEESEEGRPSWSADGRFIYFRSDRSGAREVWKVPADKPAPARRITTGGGYEAFESPDGATLYYTRERSQPGLWSMPVGGGEGVRVLDNIREGYWAVARDGVYYLDVSASRAPDRTWPIRRFAFATRRDELVSRVGAQGGDLWSGFSVRPDGRYVLWCQMGRHTSDLLLVDSVE